MNVDAVYVKTQQGRTAIAERTLNLSPKQRQLLIMIDGKRRLKEIIPTINDEVLARVKALETEHLISNVAADTSPSAVEATTVSSDENHLQPTTLPNDNQRQQIRQILSMCSQQYLGDELDIMLTNVFDVMTELSEFQFCLDHWEKRMRNAMPPGIVQMYIEQLRRIL